MAFLAGMGGFGGGGDIGQGLIRIGAQTSGLRGEVRQAVRGIRSELQAGARDIEGTGRQWNSAFGAIGAAAKVGFLGVASAVGVGIGAAIQFESAFAGVRKTLDATPAQLARVRQEFRDLAKEIPISVNELAKIGETAGSLGIAVENVTEFTRVVALIGETTNVSTDQAATALGQLSNVLHLQQRDYERFASALVDLGNKGASTESQILEIAARAGAAGSLIKLSTTDILGFASAVASVGVEVEAGGSSLQNFFLKVQQIVGTGAQLEKLADTAGVTVTQFLKLGTTEKGMDRLRKATGLTANQLSELFQKTEGLDLLAQTAGMTAVEFQRAFERDAGGALQAFLAGLGKLPGASQQAVLATLKMNDIRITRTLLSLAGNTQLVADNLRNSEQAWKANSALAAEAGKRFETTASQIELLKNIVQDLFISLGDSLLPQVKGLVAVMQNDVPRAARFIGQVWDTILRPAFESLAGSASRLMEAVVGLFGSEQAAQDWGSTMGDVVSNLARVFAQVVRFAGGFLDILGAILDNPAGQALARILGAIVAIRVAFSGAAAAAQLLGARTRALGRSALGVLTFGRVGGAAESTSLDPAASALKGSAGRLDEAAAALKGSARAVTSGATGPFPQARAGGNLNGPIQFAPDPAGSRRVGGSLLAESGQLIALDRTIQAEYVRHRRAIAAAGEGIIRRTMADVADGISAGTRNIRRVGARVLGGLSNLFWGALIADLGIEFLKAPIGDLIASNPQFQRAGAMIREDFVGGVIALFTKSLQGADAAVGRAETMTVAGARFSTVTLAKLGITNAIFDKLEAPEGSIENLEGSLAALVALRARLPRQANEKILDWYRRIGNDLPEELRQQIDRLYQQRDFANPEAAEQQIGDLLNQWVRQQLSERAESLHTGYVQSLRQTLVDRGFTRGQIGQLSTEELANLGNILKHDAQGQYSFLVEFLARSYIDGVQQGPTRQEISKRARATIAALTKSFGKDWADGLRALTSAEGAQADPETARRLRQLLGKDWQTLLREAVATLPALSALPPEVRTLIQQAGAANLPALRQLQQNVVTAINDFMQNTPQNVRDAIVAFQQRAQLIDPEIESILERKFGKDWLTAFRNGTRALSADDESLQPVIREFARLFGPHWRAALQGFGSLLFEQQGGADIAILKKALRSALHAAIAAIPAEDLAPPVPVVPRGTPRTEVPEIEAPNAQDAEKQRKAVQKVVDEAISSGTLAATTSQDATKSKKAIQDLGERLAKAVPNEATRKRLVETLVEIQRAGATPNLDGVSRFVKSTVQEIPDLLARAGTAFDNLGLKVLRFLTRTSGSSGNVSGGVQSGQVGRALATGAVFDTKGTTDLTVGEAGREHVAVLRNFRTVRLPSSAPVLDQVVSRFIGAVTGEPVQPRSQAPRAEPDRRPTQAVIGVLGALARMPALVAERLRPLFSVLAGWRLARTEPRRDRETIRTSEAVRERGSRERTVREIRESARDAVRETVRDSTRETLRASLRETARETSQRESTRERVSQTREQATQTREQVSILREVRTVIADVRQAVTSPRSVGTAVTQAVLREGESRAALTPVVGTRPRPRDPFSMVRLPSAGRELGQLIAGLMVQPRSPHAPGVRASDETPNRMPSRTTQIFADKLQVLGPASETSLISRLAFLGND